MFKGKNVEYDAIYEYCERTDELIAREEMISANEISMKNAHLESTDSLVSPERETSR